MQLNPFQKQGSSGQPSTQKNFGTALGTGLGIAAAPALAPAFLLGAGIKAASDNSKRTVSPVRQSREMLAADVNTLRNDPGALGLSDAERQKMIADATQQAGALQQAQTSQLAQAALAGTPQASQQLQQAAQGIAAQGGQAAVQAASGVNQLNQQIIDSEKQRIRAALEAERERVKENTRFWLNMGITGVGALISAATGGGAGIAAGLGGAAMGGGQAAAAPSAVQTSSAVVPPSTYFMPAQGPQLSPPGQPPSYNPFAQYSF